MSDMNKPINNHKDINWDVCPIGATCNLHRLDCMDSMAIIKNKQTSIDQYFKDHKTQEKEYHEKMWNALEDNTVATVKATTSQGWIKNIGYFIIVTTLSVGAYMLARVENNEGRINKVDTHIAVIKTILTGEVEE